MLLNNLSDADLYKISTKVGKEFKGQIKRNPFISKPAMPRLEKDTISFRGGQPKQNTPAQGILAKLLAFTGVKATQKDVENYLQDFDKYADTAELHNRILYSYGDPSSMSQVLADAQKRAGKTKDELFTEVKETMFNLFDKLKTSPVVVVEGTKLNDFSFLNKEKYQQIQKIYADILQRPETFSRVRFDTNVNKLVETMTSEDIAHKSEDLNHIINDILPQLLESKTFVTQDPANLQKLLSDEVVQSLILEKLYEEHPEDWQDPFAEKSDKHDHDKHDHDKHVCNFDGHGHTHDHSKTEGSKHDHDHSKTEGSEHDHDHKHDHHHKPEEKLQLALDLLNKIHEKFDVTMASKVPDHFYDPLSKDKNALNIPNDYYDKKLLGLRQTPRNFYEAKFLKMAAKNVKSFKPNNTVIVTPKGPASDIVEKVKALNKEYLYIEDWLYKYCLGDQKTKDQILQQLNTASDSHNIDEFKKLAKELDTYLNDFVKVYDIKKPENNENLNKAMEDYSKINCMSEISRGYFLGVGEDSKDLIKTLLGLALFGHVAEHAAEASGVGFIINLSNTTMSVADDVLDACKNYLKWKKEFGDEKAKEKLHSTISHSLTISLPTLALKLSPNDGPLQHLIFRNASSGSTYAIVISTMVEYYNKLEELIDKGVRQIPEDIKDDPDKVAKWKLTEAWKGFAAHSLNRGTFMGIAVSQPFAMLAQPIMKLVAPIGGRPIVIALAGTLECWTSNIYLLLDSSHWNKFTHNLKDSFVKDKEAKMTPEEYLELRKSTTTKIIESNIGQAGLGASMTVAKHFPKKLASGIKKAYMSVFNIVSKTIGGAVAGVCQTVLDRKYNNMTDE
ncbi:MAG: hypothetical protein AB1782_17830 [Cyanobacteriota bacterium]